MAGRSVAENLLNLESRVRAVCRTHGRDPVSVHILAVAKLQPLARIREAFACGQRHFAENYVQEAVRKQEQLHSLPAQWHFIGRLQANKVKYLEGRFAAIHSLDRAPLAAHLNRLSPAGRQERQDVFLQYNVAAEASKGGVGEEELRALARFVMAECPRLRVLGLMVMPPPDSESSGNYFRKTRELQEELRATLTPAQRQAHPFDQLSMGTSADFETAIAEGATWIRIGTELFGPREEKQ